MKKTIYIIASLAFRHIQGGREYMLITDALSATSPEEAWQIGMGWFMRDFPLSDGWHNHDVKVRSFFEVGVIEEVVQEITQKRAAQDDEILGADCIG